MDQYLIYLCTDFSIYTEGIDTLKELLRARECSSVHLSAPRLTSVNRTYAVLLSVTDEDLNDETQEAAWTDISEGLHFKQCSLWQCQMKGDGKKTLATCLHELAETLPILGTRVDIIWAAGASDVPEIGDNLELFGALKRLQEWNSASLTFLVSHVDEAQCSSITPWADMLRGRCSTAGDLLQQETHTPVIWRGSVSLAASESMKAVRLGGFEMTGVRQREETVPVLTAPVVRQGVSWKTVKQSGTDQSDGDQCPSRVLSQQLELLAEVDIRDIPTFYIKDSYSKLAIATKSRLVKKSRAFLQHLYDNPWLGYLVRLDYGSSWTLAKDDALPKDTENRETKGWADLVRESVANIINCPFVTELEGDLGQYLFLLCSPNCPMVEPLTSNVAAISPDAQSDNIASHCWAFSMRQPQEISGATVRQLTATLSSASDNDVGNQTSWVKDCVDRLPHYFSTELVELTKRVEKAQLEALHDWIDMRRHKQEPVEVTADELCSILESARERCLENLQQASRIDRVTANVPTRPRRQVISELDPLTLPERLALSHRCNRNSGSLGRFKSSDSLAGLSPPSRGYVLTLDAAQFLKYFKSDGKARKENSSLVNLKKGVTKNKWMKLGSGELQATPWPECTNYNCHDLYYNHGQAEEKERKADRLKSRLQSWETESTCSYRQSHSPATLTLVDPDQNLPNEPSPAVTETRGRGNRKVGEGLERVSTRNRVKRKSDGGDKPVKRVATVKKPEARRASEGQMNRTLTQAEGESRSQRHKRKLEEIVKLTLIEEGVQKGDPIFKSCALKLYTITKCFIKDLASSRGLKHEMEKVARSNVKQIIDFARQRMAK